MLTLLSCRSAEPKVALDCAQAAFPDSVLSLEGARAAYRRAEETRELRYREAIEPGYLLRNTREQVSQSKIDRRQVCFEQLFHVGRLLFEHEYGFADGLGRDDASTRADPFRRVHEGGLGGPETNSCTSCHWRGGPAGAGSLQDNSFVMGNGTNIDSAEPRNPPALQGSGVVQALAQEMNRELRSQLAGAVQKARSERKTITVELESKNISFGRLSVAANGALDTSAVQGVDADMIIRPFGWRGEFATLRDFVVTSAQVHLGMQSEDLLRMPGADALGSGPPDDRDNDGVVAELSAGQLTALVVYLAALELPIVAAPEVLHDAAPAAAGLGAPLAHNYYDRFAEGQRLFADIGCASCHRPMLVLKNPTFTTVSAVTGKPYQIDLSKDGPPPRLRYEPSVDGYPVWLFSDMKRHDLGPEAASSNPPEGRRASEFLSRRLWGLASSAPYFYDGRAPTILEAIEYHGGDAAFAREDFRELTGGEKGSLHLYLMSLRRSPTLLVP